MRDRVNTFLARSERQPTHNPLWYTPAMPRARLLPPGERLEQLICVVLNSYPCVAVALVFAHRSGSVRGAGAFGLRQELLFWRALPAAERCVEPGTDRRAGFGRGSLTFADALYDIWHSYNTAFA